MKLIVTPKSLTNGKRLPLKVGQTFGRGDLTSIPNVVSKEHFVVQKVEKMYMYVIKHTGKNAGEIVRFETKERIEVKKDDVVKVYLRDYYFPVKDFDCRLQAPYTVPFSVFRGFSLSGFINTCKKMSDVELHRFLVEKCGTVTPKKMRMIKSMCADVWLGRPNDYLAMLTPETMKEHGIRKKEVTETMKVMNSCEEIDAKLRRGEIADFYQINEDRRVDLTDARKAEIAEQKRISEEILRRWEAGGEEEEEGVEEIKEDEADEEDEEEENDEEDDGWEVPDNEENSSDDDDDDASDPPAEESAMAVDAPAAATKEPEVVPVVVKTEAPEDKPCGFDLDALCKW